MKPTVKYETYKAVMEKYEGRCQHPRCGVMGVPTFNGVKTYWEGVEYSHILSRGKFPEYRDEVWNGIPLCPKHHRTGVESVHQSKDWEQYYFRFLPDWVIEKHHLFF